MDKYICIHGHFYQPPRENAWLEEVELQDSAYPHHDWNERITAECYAPNTASRILDTDGRITDIVNNYSKISFNFGPTLLLWMERHHPETYEAVLEADRLSMEIFSGHGSALAQAYHHMIMPLANRRDKYTQILWGIRDFEYRFKRFPEGIWLPETAVDIHTLEILADLGIQFTILAPQQARRARELKRNARWRGVAEGTIDPSMAYLCRLPSGNKVTIFFYDGKISQEVAFGGLLGNGEDFAKKIMGAFSEERKHPQLVNIATDGETYGHHHRGGDMALAYCLNYIESKKLVKLTNYAEFLANHPPTHEVAIYENSSWSCIHGIERWRDNCGCHSGMHPEWTQLWRKPLREALDELRFSAINLYEEGTRDFLGHPWEARDDYISVVLDRSEENVQRFFQKHASRELSAPERIRFLKYLEMQRNAMMMYTSCGWFFDEISGIETVQIMQYASRVIQLAMDTDGVSLEENFLDALALAPSNVYEDGRKPYEMFVKPAAVDLLRVAVHHAVSSVFQEYPSETGIFCFRAGREEYDILRRNGNKLATGKSRIISDITRNEKIFSFAVLHIGDFNIVAGVREYDNDESYRLMQGSLRQEFEREDPSSVSKILHEHFGDNIFSFSHLFRDEQRKIIRQIMDEAQRGIDTSCRRVYEDYREIMGFFRSLDVQIPRPFTVSAEYIINRDLKKIFENGIDIEKLKSLTEEIKKWSIDLETATIGFVASGKITSLMENLSANPDDTALIETVENTLKLMSALPIDLDLWKSQNIYFSIGQRIHGQISGATKTMDESQHKWMEAFRKLGYYLHVKIAAGGLLSQDNS